MRDPKLRETNGWYNVHFYDPARRPQRKAVALGTRRKAEAERAYRRILADFEAGRYDPWTDTRRPGEGALTVLDAHERFVGESEKRHARGLLSAATLRDYRSTLGGLLKRLPAGLPLVALDATLCEGLVRRPGLSPASERSYRRKLSVFLAWSVEQRLIRTNPLDGVERPAAYTAAPAWLRRDEFKRLLTAIGADSIRAATPAKGYNGHSPLWIERAVRLAVATGLRLSELVSLRWEDVDMASGFLYVREHTGDDGRLKRTKGRRYRTVPLFPAAREVLTELGALRASEDDRATVLLAQGGGPVHAPHLSKRFRDMRRLAKLPDEIHFHSLRHTFCSWLRLDGVDLDRIREWAGHRTIQQTLAYAHIIPEHIAHEGASAFPALTQAKRRGRARRRPDVGAFRLRSLKQRKP